MDNEVLMLLGLTITSLVINSVSIGLSALTSLDWQKEKTHERKFKEMLRKSVHARDGAGRIVVVGVNGSESLRGLEPGQEND